MVVQGHRCSRDTHPVCKIRARPRPGQQTKHSTQTLVSPKGAKPPFLGEPPPKAPHLLQAAAVPGRALGVGAERLPELLDAARGHRDLPLGHQDVLPRDSAASGAGLSPPALPAPTLLCHPAAPQRGWHHRAGDDRDTKWLLPTWTDCLYKDQSSRRCSIPQWGVLLWGCCSSQCASPSTEGLGGPSAWACGHSEHSWGVWALTNRVLLPLGWLWALPGAVRGMRELRLSRGWSHTRPTALNPTLLHQQATATAPPVPGHRGSVCERGQLQTTRTGTGTGTGTYCILADRKSVV